MNFLKKLKQKKVEEKKEGEQEIIRHFLVKARLFSGKRFFKEEILHVKSEQGLLFNEQTEKLKIYKTDYAKNNGINSVRFDLPVEYSEADCVNFKSTPEWLKEHRKKLQAQQQEPKPENRQQRRKRERKKTK